MIKNIYQGDTDCDPFSHIAGSPLRQVGKRYDLLFFLCNLLSSFHLLVRQDTGRMFRICLSLLRE